MNSTFERIKRLRPDYDVEQVNFPFGLIVTRKGHLLVKCSLHSIGVPNAGEGVKLINKLLTKLERESYEESYTL